MSNMRQFEDEISYFMFMISINHDLFFIAKKMKNNDYQFKNIYENIESFQLFEEYKTFDKYILILTSSSKE